MHYALQGIAILNIPSTHGGTNMWGDSKAKASRKKKKEGDRYIEETSKEKSKLANTFLKAKVYESFAIREYSSTSSLGDLIDLSGAVQVGQIWRREKFTDSFGNSIWHSRGVDIVYSFVGYW